MDEKPTSAKSLKDHLIESDRSNLCVFVGDQINFCVKVGV